MLSSEEVDQIRAGDWELDCSEIIVCNRTGSVRSTGPGSIRQTPRGRLAFKLYGNACGPKVFAYGSGAAGQIIPDDEYYDLSARDTTGRVWTSEHILVHERGTADGQATVLTGELLRLVHRFEFRGSAPDMIVLRFFEDLEIPPIAGQWLVLQSREWRVRKRSI